MPFGRASRMEGSGIVDRIQVTEDVVENLGDRFPSYRESRSRSKEKE